MKKRKAQRSMMPRVLFQRLGRLAKRLRSRRARQLLKAALVVLVAGLLFWDVARATSGQIEVSLLLEGISRDIVALLIVKALLSKV